ncbi:proton-coupled zinc antiporter SLC30A1-like [Carassius carassius]|uniref:proton-coupled zinc antiporter SLC30A1-like n=1 Tax=Carassius carassius TaxID=217509 RepID=UPI002868F8FA|nr:proton-coupled zinc antiporter SLC30A1-like [Carassius carassius]
MVRISSSSSMCVLVFTLGFLVFEIVVGQICRSLLIAVDSFHTLYVFINLALSAIKHHFASSRPDVCASGALSSLCVEDYRRMRLKPFGVLISALILASQCVSISLQILTHLVQPEPVQHPLLSTVVGGTSLIFNVLVLACSRGTDEAADGISKSLVRNDPYSTFNPEASSVLDPGRAESPKSSISDPVQSSPAQTPIPRICGSAQDIIQHSEPLPGEPRRSACTEPTVSRCAHGLMGSIAVVQDLLGSVLVLCNGLVLLLSAAHCHQPHSDCHLLVYLDAGLSSVCVLVLLSVALPRLWRCGLLVLQATLLHVSVAQVRRRITRVPGVLSVHELHVWQLSEALLVASLHVHCPAELNAAHCTDLMERITAALNAFGIKHCTVQPELSRSAAATCSLRCGQECVDKLCCSPREEQEESCSPAPYSGDQITDVVIQSTYL